MKRALLVILALLVTLMLAVTAMAEDPFAAGADALAVNEDDGSSSLRAKLKLKRMTKDMVLARVVSLDDSKFPKCIMKVKILKAAKSKAKYFKLIGKGKTYSFAPVLKMKKGKLVLKDQMTQNNLGACYYPKKTKLVIKVSGVDLKAKVFKAAEIYVK